uniref:Uncharacterized protein n=1 Tax=Strigamia maritima TaxID=126957 RepID=T1IXB6_STRMM
MSYNHYRTPHWVQGSHGNVSPQAVQAGHDGGPLYVGRAHHDGDLIPGKIQPGHGTCYISHGGNEISKPNYEVLINSGQWQMQWLPSSNGQVPSGAIQGGRTSNGEPLYIGRVNHNGTLTIGKIHPSHGCIYIPYDGREHSNRNYEVLVCSSKYKRAGKWEHSNDGGVPDNAVQAGWDVSDTIYVGRAHHEGEVIPGKVVPSHGCCYVAFGGEEHKKSQYEVLCNPCNCSLEWVGASDGAVPNGALQGGVTDDGENLFIGRTQHEGTLTVGKVHPSHGCLYIPFGGGEHNYEHYEVLVCKIVPLD